MTTKVTKATTSKLFTRVIYSLSRPQGLHQRANVLSVILCLFLSLFLGVAIVWQGILALLLPLGIALVAFIFYKPQFFPALLILYIWLLQGRTDPGQILESVPAVRWATYAMIPIVVTRAATLVALRRQVYRTPIDVALVVTLIIIVLAGLVNRDSPLDIMLALGVYLRYPLLFWALVNLDLGLPAYRWGLQCLLLASFLAVPETMLAFTVGRTSDAATWTFGTFGTAPLGLFLLCAQSVVISWGLIDGWRWYHSMLVVLLFIPATIGTIRALFLVVPLLSVALLFWSRESSRDKRFIRRLLALILIFLTLFSLSIAVSAIWDIPLEVILTRPWVLLGVPDLGGVGVLTYQDRLQSLVIVITKMLRDGALLLGWGVRSFNPGAFFGRPAGYGYNYLVGLYGPDPVVGSQWVRGFGEIGLVGMIIYYVMLISLLLVNRRMWNETSDKQWRIASCSFFGIWMAYAVLSPWYYDVWRMDALSAPFWLFAAAIFTELRRRDRATMETTPAVGIVTANICSTRRLAGDTHGTKV